MKTFRAFYEARNGPSIPRHLSPERRYIPSGHTWAPKSDEERRIYGWIFDTLKVFKDVDSNRLEQVKQSIDTTIGLSSIESYNKVRDRIMYEFRNIINQEYPQTILNTLNRTYAKEIAKERSMKENPDDAHLYDL